MPRHGPKLKLTSEIRDKVVTYLRAGNYVETAASCVGIHKDTFYEWMKRGRRGIKPYAEFAEAVDKAVSESEARDVALLAKAATENWQAAAWRLERKHPTRWGRHDRHEISGPDGEAVKVQVGVVLLPPEKS